MRSIQKQDRGYVLVVKLDRRFTIQFLYLRKLTLVYIIFLQINELLIFIFFLSDIGVSAFTFRVSADGKITFRMHDLAYHFCTIFTQRKKSLCFFCNFMEFSFTGYSPFRCFL